MAKHLNKGLEYVLWPASDRQAFERLSKEGDIFDRGAWSHLSVISVRSRKYGYGKWLGFLSNSEKEALNSMPAERVSRSAVEAYVASLRRNCTETTAAICVQHLRLTISAIAPELDWHWLYRVERRLANRATPLPKKRVLSLDLYALGLQMIDEAKSKAFIHGRPILAAVEHFRDGLMIALLAEAPMRRAAFAGLCIGENVIKVAGRWRIYVTAFMVKTRVAQDYELSEELGTYLDEYLDTFRPVFENSGGHQGMWPYGERPMVDKMIRRYLRKHTEAYLGYAVTPHDFRRAAATFAATADPGNVLVAKDLLGHQSFAMTEKHYVHGARSRLAANVLADAIGRKLG